MLVHGDGHITGARALATKQNHMRAGPGILSPSRQPLINSPPSSCSIGMSIIQSDSQLLVNLGCSNMFQFCAYWWFLKYQTALYICIVCCSPIKMTKKKKVFKERTGHHIQTPNRKKKKKVKVNSQKLSYVKHF